MSRKLIEAFIESSKTLKNIKQDIDQEFVNNNIKIEEMEIKKNITRTFSFVALIKSSQSPTKIKKLLNKIGTVKWFIVVTGTAATKKRHKKWNPKVKTMKNK